jgi:hypothetical protein
VYKNPVFTSQITPSMSYTKTNMKILCREIITLDSERPTKYIHIMCAQNAESLIVTAGDMYRYRLAVTPCHL